MARTNLPVAGLHVREDGQIKPFYRPNGHGLADVRQVSGEFLLSFQDFWRRRGDEMLERTADKFPELMVASMVKIAQVTRVEIGGPGEFAKLGNKQAIVEKLEQKAGPEARKLFEKFVRDVEKLQAQQKQDTR